MNNIVLNWKVISKGIPAGPENANDRIPTIDEILEVLKYSDRKNFLETIAGPPYNDRLILN